MKKKEYSLIGVDGNAYSVMGYVCNALNEVGLGDLTKTYMSEATSGNYDNLLVVSMKYIDEINKREKEKNAEVEC